jgi:hypothetical protein
MQQRTAMILAGLGGLAIAVSIVAEILGKEWLYWPSRLVGIALVGFVGLRIRARPTGEWKNLLRRR